MKRKKKGGRNAVGSRNGGRRQSRLAPSGSGEGTGALAPADQPAPAVEDNRPRRVVLDNTVPEGFRMEPV